MNGSPSSGPPPSLLRVTFRRATILGRFFLLYGIGLATLLGVALSLTAGAAFAAAYPLILPIFGAVGSMGALTVFTSDRTKGAIEYYLAYGVSPRQVFVNHLVTCLALVSIILGVAGTVGVGVYLARGHPVTTDLVLGIGVYAVPMTYTAAAFATMTGMYWSVLSSPSTGMNSPIGVAPLLGVLPPVAVLLTITALGIAGVTSTTELDLVAILVMAIVAAITLILIGMVGRLLRTERLLSPA